MLSIQNENVLRDSGPTNLQTWRSEVPRGSALDQIMEDALNHATAIASAKSTEDEDMEEELEEARSEARTMKSRAADRATELLAAEKALHAEKSAHEATRAMAEDLRAKAAALLWLVPGSVSLAEMRDLHRTFAADFAELERLRVYETEMEAMKAEWTLDKAAQPEPDPEDKSAEIPEEMFAPRHTKTWSMIDEAGNVVPIPEPGSEGTFICHITDQGASRLELATLTPEQIEDLKRTFEPTNGRIIPIPARSRKRLDALARRAHEIADGRAVAPDTRRLADLLAALANAVEPKS